jgi:hypothetical protein
MRGLEFLLARSGEVTAAAAAAAAAAAVGRLTVMVAADTCIAMPAMRLKAGA